MTIPDSTKTENELIAAAFNRCRDYKIPMTDDIYAIFKDGYREKESELTITYLINSIIKILARNRDNASRFIGHDANGKATFMYNEVNSFINELEKLHDFVTNSQDLKQ